jgi:formylglycine-generating enzyme required for sulfatase activity
LGSTKISSTDNMLMVFVPAGEFLMGSEFGLSDEQPVHTVYLDAYWLDQTEVTNAMYEKCVIADKCKPPNSGGSFENPISSTAYSGNKGYADHPVVFVSWSDAVDYCSWAGRRLPTEAEWEKAARWDSINNTALTYPWGNEYDCKMGNFDDETELDASLMPGQNVGCDAYVQSAPVGSFPLGKSPYGILDMGGNVWEWVHDAFIEVDPLSPTFQNYYAISPLRNPQGVDPAVTEYRIMRGGSWNWTFGFGRSAYRLWFGRYDVYDNVGFRCASSD